MGLNLTVAQAILKALAAWGVKNIYGVSGDSILPLMDALGKQEEIKYFSTASEQGASFMACGEARVTGRPGVCLASEGPGALNVLNGVADAYRDGIALLAITGQVETHKLDSSAKQYFNQQQLFAPVTGLTTLLTRPESVLDVLKIAVEKAIGDSVPCHISIPKDLLTAAVRDRDIPQLGPFNPPEIHGDLKKTVQVLKRAKRLLFIAGRVSFNYKDIILELADMTGAGIIPSQGAGGVFPGTEKRVVGSLGEAHIPPAVNKADCILLIGSSPYEYKFIPAGIDVVQIDVSPRNLAGELSPVLLTGDLKKILEHLKAQLNGFEPDGSWEKEIKENHESWLEMITKEAELTGTPVSPRKVVSVLNEILPRDAVVAVDTGEFMHWFDRGFIARSQRVLISEFWRCMGSGLSFALGAQNACPGKKVAVVTGDGCFLMCMQEILTAVRYSLPVVVIVINTKSYLLEKHRMQKQGMKPYGVSLEPPDITVLAGACGAKGIRVDESDTLKDKLVEAFSSQEPVVVDILSSTEKPCFI